MLQAFRSAKYEHRREPTPICEGYGVIATPCHKRGGGFIEQDGVTVGRLVQNVPPPAQAPASKQSLSQFTPAAEKC